MDKITLKFHDEEREIDLTSADGQSKLKELAEKGYAYENGQTALKTLKQEKEEVERIVSTWNSQIELAKTDPEAKEQLLAQLKAQGLDLTAKQASEFVEEKDERLDEINKKISDLTAENGKLNNMLLSQVYDQEHTQYESI